VLLFPEFRRPAEVCLGNSASSTTNNKSAEASASDESQADQETLQLVSKLTQRLSTRPDHSLGSDDDNGDEVDGGQVVVEINKDLTNDDAGSGGSRGCGSSRGRQAAADSSTKPVSDNAAGDENGVAGNKPDSNSQELPFGIVEDSDVELVKKPRGRPHKKTVKAKAAVGGKNGATDSDGSTAVTTTTRQLDSKGRSSRNGRKVSKVDSAADTTSVEHEKDRTSKLTRGRKLQAGVSNKRHRQTSVSSEVDSGKDDNKHPAAPSRRSKRKAQQMPKASARSSRSVKSARRASVIASSDEEGDGDCGTSTRRGQKSDGNPVKAKVTAMTISTEEEDSLEEDIISSQPLSKVGTKKDIFR
jgi:hypothetical protein